MNYNFFADKQDKIEILKFILNEPDLHVYDMSSEHGREICEYTDVDEIISKFDLDNGGKFALTFQLWSPKTKGKPIFRKIELDPKYVKGATFRYATEGLGLIQLYFGGIHNGELNQSHIGHFNEQGAANSGYPLDKVANWDWAEIKKGSNKLKYQINSKMAIRKMGSLGILPGADELEKQGLKLR